MPNHFLNSTVGSSVLKLNADKGGASGGSGKKTDLEQLQDAQAENKKLVADLETARQSIKDEVAKVTAAKAAQKNAEEQLAQATKDTIAAVERAEKAESEVEKLQGDAKTIEQKAAEIAAAHGSLPAVKDGENATGMGANEKKMTRKQFDALDPDRKSAFCLKGGVLID